MKVAALFKSRILQFNLGSALEYYDFVLFAIFIEPITHSFFPADQISVAYLQSLSTFALAYIVRPLGGMIFGHLGDRYGRKLAFTYAIFLMAVATLGISLLPTYQTIGIASTYGLVLLRLLQGLSQGAELPGAIAYMSEMSQPTNKARYNGLLFISITIGTTVATLVGHLMYQWCSSSQLLAWGWRLPFFLGSIIAGVGYMVRKHGQESALFKIEAMPRTPLLVLWGQYQRSIWMGIGLTLLPMSLIIINLFLPKYFHHYFDYSLERIYKIQFLATLWCGIAIWMFAKLADLKGYSTVYQWAIMIMMTGFWIFFNLRSFGTMLDVGIFLFFYQSVIAALVPCFTSMLAELFPVSVRYTGIAMAYNVACSLAAFMPVLSESICRTMDTSIGLLWLLLGIGSFSFIHVLKFNYQAKQVLVANY